MLPLQLAEIIQKIPSVLTRVKFKHTLSCLSEAPLHTVFSVLYVESEFGKFIAD